MKRVFVPLLSVLMLSGCAELTSFNQAVGDAAGKLTQVLGSSSNSTSSSSRSHSGYRYTVEDSALSSRNIDSLYVKIKRNFKFQTREEALTGLTDYERSRYNSLLDEEGHAHETTPGVYYHMATGYKNNRYLDVTLGKEGNKVRIDWVASSNESDFGAFVKQEMLKTIR